MFKHTRIVILVFDERWTTKSKDMTRPTTTPTSMFQMMDRKNVSDIIVRSTQADMLKVVVRLLGT